MKTLNYLLLFAFILLTQYSWGQGEEKPLTRIYNESPPIGSFIRAIEYNLPNLKTSNTYILGQKIKVIEQPNEMNTYFYSISDGASVEYSILLEIIDAVSTLKTTVDKDIELKPDYLDNKYTNLNGFCVGYFVRMDKIKKTWFATWYIYHDQHNSDRILTFKDVGIIEEAFYQAKTKIEELKAY